MKVIKEDWLIRGWTEAREGDAKSLDVQKTLMKKIQSNWNDLMICEQVHGSRVSVVSDRHKNFFPATDGLATKLPQIVLAVFSADCLPIFLVEPAKRIIGILHAGWRGIVKKIAQKGVTLFRSKWRAEPSRLKVYFGPHIRECCYEIRRDLSALFSKKCQIRAKDKLFLNLQKAAALQLQESGVLRKNIFQNRLCTCCDSRFFSYRRDKTPKRILSFIAQAKPAAFV